MSLEHIAERVTRLEEKVSTSARVTEDNTRAIRELTAALNKGRGAWWVLTTLASIAAAMGAVSAWFYDKVIL